LSSDQVVALGYYRRPPLVPTCGQHVGQSKEHLYHTGNPRGRNPRERGCWNGARPVHFPQLDGLLITPPDDCEYCGRDDFATEAALKQHQSVMHADRRQQLELADGIVAGLVRSGSLPRGSTNAAEIATAVVLALRQLEQPEPDPMPDPDADEAEDEDQPEAPEPAPEPEPAPAKSGWQRQRERQATLRADD
jgi:hypothetical protein